MWVFRKFLPSLQLNTFGPRLHNAHVHCVDITYCDSGCLPWETQPNRICHSRNERDHPRALNLAVLIHFCRIRYPTSPYCSNGAVTRPAAKDGSSAVHSRAIFAATTASEHRTPNPPPPLMSATRLSLWRFSCDKGRVKTKHQFSFYSISHVCSLH